MRLAGQDQFDPADPPWLHCISRCVRRAFLCGEGYEHRRAWIERRLRLLSACFSVEVGAYAVMSNHLQAVLRPRPDRVAEWSDEQVALAWWRARHDVDPWDPEPDPDRAQAPDPEELASLVANRPFIARWRACLTALYSINEPEEGSDLYAMAADIDHNVSLIHELRGDREETSQIRRPAEAG